MLITKPNMLALKNIGTQLNESISPLVFNGGIVMPNGDTISSINMGGVNEDERQEQNRPTTRQRKRTTRRQGKTRQSRTTCSATQIFRSGLHEIYNEEFNELKMAYPGIKIWEQKNGVWLLCQIGLLHGSLQKAVLLCGIPFNPTQRVRSWGFWNGTTWIGPRHTNMPDGSICAFNPSDCTWVPGDSIIKLLDIYTLWVIRHLHLIVFMQWPGAQVANFAYERLIELKDDELCGCGSIDKKYGDCCKPNDLKRNKVADAIKFIFSGGANRKPPDDVIRFMSERDNPPLLKNI